MTEINPSDYWLLRDSKNLIWGPIPRREIIEMIRDHKLKPRTEISHSQSYWFGIEETREIARFFPELGDVVQVDNEHEATQATQGISTKTVPGEWLSDEYAEEFGYVINETADGTSVAVAKAQAAAAPSEYEHLREDEPTYVPQFEGGTDPTIPVEEAVRGLREQDKKRRLIFFGTLACVVVAAFGMMFVDRYMAQKKKAGEKTLQVGVKGQGEALGVDGVISNLRVSLLLGDISGVQEQIADLETRLEVAENKSDAKRIEFLTQMAKAIMRRELLFDSAGAVNVLTALKSANIGDARQTAEIDNLLAIYQLESNPQESIRLFREVVKANPQDDTAQYNLAIAYLVDEQADKAQPLLAAILPNLEKGDRLIPRVQLALGHAGGKDAEAHLLAALESDPYLAEAQLLLALGHWRSGRKSKAEGLVRRFIDTLPGYRDALYVKNFRRAEFPQAYNAARTEVRTLLARTQPDDLMLALDGMLSVLVGEYKDAEQALDRSMQAAPGNIYALKVLSYMRLREGKEFEIESLVKSKIDANKESFAFNVLLAHSYQKQGKLEEAAALYQQLTQADARLSLGYSLLGDVQGQLKRGEKAVQLYQSALERDPYDITALRGMSVQGRGDRVNALLLQSLLPF